MTLENVLAGKINQPRVQLSWRKAEKPKSHKCDVHNENKELQQLAAGGALLPEELVQQSQEELEANVRCVEEKIDRSQWPWFTWHSLLQHRLQSTLGSDEWASFLESLWSWGEVPEIAPAVACGAASSADAGGAASPAEQAAPTLNISQPKFPRHHSSFGQGC